MSRRLDYVVLYVKDLAKSIEFYRDVVGLEFKFEQSGYAEFKTDGCKFGLFEDSQLASLIDTRMGTDGPSMEIVLLVANVDAEAGRLEKAGVQLLSGPVDRAWGHRTIHFYDPDRHVVEFAQEIPRQAPRG